MVYSVQVKRLKSEDPLQSLVLRGYKRKFRDDEHEADGQNSSNSDLVFRLAETYPQQQPGNSFVLQGTSSPGSEARTYRVASKLSKRVKRDKEDDSPAPPKDPHQDENEVSAELRDMIAKYMKPEGKAVNVKMEDADTETEDYVYDVYFGELAPGTATESVGYIDINEEEEKLLFGPSDDENETPFFNDDEDSNAENYYKNDYPDDDEGDDEDDSQILGFSDDNSFAEDLQYHEELWSEDETEISDLSYRRYGWND